MLSGLVGFFLGGEGGSCGYLVIDLETGLTPGKSFYCMMT